MNDATTSTNIDRWLTHRIIIVYALFGWWVYKNALRPQPSYLHSIALPAPNIFNFNKKSFKPLSHLAFMMWTSAIVGGPHTLPTLSLPPIYAPRLSASFATLARKLVFLCPYLRSSQPVYVSTPTTSFDGPSVTYGAPSPTRLPAASPSMTITVRHEASIPLWIIIGLSGIIILATYYVTSRSRPEVIRRAKCAAVSNKSDKSITTISQTYIFILGLGIGVAIGLSIHSTPIPLIISVLAQNSLDLPAYWVSRYSDKLRSFLGWKTEVCRGSPSRYDEQDVLKMNSYQILRSVRYVSVTVKSLSNGLGSANTQHVSWTYESLAFLCYIVSCSLWYVRYLI